LTDGTPNAEDIAGQIVAADERQALLMFLDAQRQAVRNTLKGLTELQVRQVPTASTMSLATLVHHLVAVEQRWTEVALAGRVRPDLWPVTDWGADFRLASDDRIGTLLAAYEAVAAETEAIVRTFDDLSEPCRDQENARFSARWILLHLIQETARHAGHGDIIRESIDGASAGMLRDARET
jgi:uncharacterized damage-inducible protein DinB